MTTPTPRHAHVRRALPSIGVLAGCLLLWVLRRPEQLTRPYVWDEESHILARYLHDGWLGAMHPVSGYEILPTNVLLPLAASISGAHLPAVMYALATLVFVATVAMIVVPQCRVGGFSLCAGAAVALALSPANPETFGVLLYSFWWASLWPVIVLGWRSTHWAWRAPVLVVASFSSPAGASMALVFALAWTFSRRRRDLVSAAIMAPGLVVELALVATSDRSSGVLVRLGDIGLQMLRTAGTFLTRWLYPTGGVDWRLTATVGATLIALLALAAVQRLRRPGDPATLLLLSATVIYLGLSSIPAALQYDPVNGGRYAFLPYATLSWMLLHLAGRVAVAWQRTTAVAMLLAAGLNLGLTFSRSPSTTAAAFSWRQQMLICQSAPEGTILHVPVLADGSVTGLWSIDLSPAQCRDLVHNSLTGRLGG